MSPTEQRLFSATQIAKAGSILRDTSSSTDKVEWAMRVLDNFRALHAEPLNVFQNTLLARLKKLELEDAIVAQRIKRKPTILEKAYPNYFARLKDFQTELNHIFSWCA